MVYDPQRGLLLVVGLSHALQEEPDIFRLTQQDDVGGDLPFPKLLVKKTFSATAAAVQSPCVAVRGCGP